MTWINDAAVVLSAGAHFVDCESGHSGHSWQQFAIDNGTSIKSMVGFQAEGYRNTSGYCPGDDDVSRTLASHGRWEPQSTALFQQAIARYPGLVIDFGSQIGWYTLIALAMRCPVLAVEAVPEHADLTLINAIRHNLDDGLRQALCWVDCDTPVLPAEEAPSIGMVKIDLEGNDRFALHSLDALIDAGNVANIIMECSPCFNDHYPKTVFDLMARGYKAAVIDPWREFGIIEVDEVIDLAPQVDMIFSRTDWWRR